MHHRLLTAAAATALALGLTLGGTPASAATGGYTALGDSYAAGVGGGAYDPASGDCHRGARSYPALWDTANQPGGAFDFAACGGATTQDVLRDQLPGVPGGSTAVTLTVGGNDLGFADVVTGCLQPFTTDARCDGALDEADRRLREELPDRLDTTYQAVTDAAPGARIAVTGYPHLLENPALCPVGTEPRRARINALTDRLDELIERQAGKHGFRFADARPAFAGHGVCAGGGEWINRIVLLTLWESFHPTADGYRLGYLPVVSAALA
ncbi:SGNH/GDSL hydrolase family protein [Kitasatospora sp. McL0602]|uniref:SGNH/GDSL hydrolase family protein n=1 Tax=Kitasatospora sp. McL0602 TaxID=3439530 RepID=UPI003F8BD8F8